MEVKGGFGTVQYWINGKEGPELATGELETRLSGYKITYKNVSQKQKNFRIDLDHGDAIALQTFHDFVRVSVKDNKRKKKQFEGSVGLMGSYPTGAKLSRDGHVMEDVDAFGKEWQVHSEEAKLFHSVEGAQHPQECEIPSTTIMERTTRRLREGAVTEEQAERACARLTEEVDRNACVFDILATNDIGMAGSY